MPLLFRIGPAIIVFAKTDLSKETKKNILQISEAVESSGGVW